MPADSPQLLCPTCGWDIRPEDVDLGRDTAFCPQCQKDFACKQWIETELINSEYLRHPPAGVSYESSTDGFTIAVAADSYSWIFVLPFALLWSALLYVFVRGSFHAPPGMGWELFLFLTPFVLLGALLWWLALIPIFGKITVTISGDEGKIFKGIGPVGFRRRFDWSSVTKVWFSTHYQTNGPNQEQVILEGDRMISVARGINQDRLRYLYIALRYHLRHRTSGA